MNAKLAPLVLLALAQTGCEPAVTATPIDPPSVSGAPFAHAKEVQSNFRMWVRLDDRNELKKLVNTASRETSEIFADPKAWPDCDRLEQLANEMLGSNTIYGIGQASTYHQYATATGCDIHLDDIDARYRDALKLVFNQHQEPLDPKQLDEAVAYLAYNSKLGVQACAHHSMRLSRQSGRSLEDAVAQAPRDCQRPGK